MIHKEKEFRLPCLDILVSIDKIDPNNPGI